MRRAGSPRRDGIDPTHDGIDPAHDGADGTVVLRRRLVPTRAVGDRLVVARPSDGAPVVLPPTAALIWRVLDGWVSPAEIDRALAAAFADVPEPERTAARVDVLAMLDRDGLLERR